MPKPTLSPSEIRSILTKLPDWKRRGQVIRRTFEFANFVTAMRFVNQVARVSEKLQHHPDIDIRWNKVTLASTTHDAKSLTALDFRLAVRCDEFALRLAT